MQLETPDFKNQPEMTRDERRGNLIVRETQKPKPWNLEAGLGI